MTIMTLDEFCGYKVVKLQLREGSNSIHSVYLKEHKVRDRVEEKPPDRTLFALGLPPYVNEESLKRVFSSFGKVEAVHLHASPTVGPPPPQISKIFQDNPPIKGFKVGYIVYENSMGVDNALSMDSTKPLILSTGETPIVLGIQKFCMDYNARLVDVSVMKKEIDQYMEDYDLRVESEEKGLKQAAEPDDEGWVTVTKKGRKPGFSRKESVMKNIMKKEENKRTKKELLNFYRFQIRQSKMNHLVKLREKFAEDKKKVAMMKQSRKFRPF